MKLILNNPYRILGLLVGATAREQERNIRRLKQYLEAGQEPPQDLLKNEFKILGPVDRTLNSVIEAESKLNLDRDKLSASIFWFYFGNPITDEPAFEALKDSDVEKAKNIWTRLTNTDNVTKQNSSAFQNLSTLLLCISVNGNIIDENLFKQGLKLKIKFLNSNYIMDFKAITTDETFVTTKKDIQITFLNSLLNEIDENGNIKFNTFINALSNLSFIAKDDFFNSLAKKLIEQIENKIENAKTKRKSDKANADKAGNELYNATVSELSKLKNLVGINDLRYSSIADKLANEILQCSIDYFNDRQDRDKSSKPLEIAMKLAQQAKSIAVGRLTKERIKDNIEKLEEMKERELSQALAVLRSIKMAYEEACRQIDRQVEELQYITVFGDLRFPNHRVSINWSKVEELKRNCLDWDKVTKAIKENIPTENIEKIKSTSNATKLNEYKTLVNFLFSIISDSYKNRIAYINFWDPVSKISPPGYGGCYIATLVYGSYDHPQVLELRKFRDEILAKNPIGKVFIKGYYIISPKLVKLLRNQKFINSLIRISLNQFIKIIQK